MTGQPVPPQLTKDEHAIVDCLSHGMGWPGIATYMRRSLSQVKHLSRGLYRKLNASNAAQAVSVAHETGLLPSSDHDAARTLAVLTERLTQTRTKSTAQPAPDRGEADHQ